VAAERGVIGLIAFLIFIGTLGWTLFRSLGPLRADQADQHQIVLTALLALIGWAIAGMTEAVFHDSSVAMLFYFVMGVALSYCRT
jgi:hypothetical protein